MAVLNARVTEYQVKASVHLLKSAEEPTHLEDAKLAANEAERYAWMIVALENITTLEEEKYTVNVITANQ